MAETNEYGIPDALTINGLSRCFEMDYRKVERIMRPAQPLNREGKRKYYTLRQFLDCYQMFVNGGGSEGKELLDYTQERAALAREQTEQQVLKNEMLRGELVPKTEIVNFYGSLVSSAKAKFLSIPSKAAALVIAMDRYEAERCLSDLVKEALNELARGDTEAMASAANAES